MSQSLLGGCYVTCRRALSSSSVDGVCAMLNHACTILEQDFREVLFSKLRQGFPSGFDLTQAYNYVQSTFSQGRIQSTDAETDKSRAAFLVSFALNNVNELSFWLCDTYCHILRLPSQHTYLLLRCNRSLNSFEWQSRLSC